jgi:ABC-type uncharacterized transport system involved in gliding motility auxiliary subunit
MIGKNSQIYTWIGVLSAIIIMICFNTIVNSYINSQRLDLTEEKMYTISSGTIETLQSIDEPINIKFYFTDRLGDNYPPFKLFSDRIKTLMKRYQDLSGGKVIFTVYNPEPFTEIEEQALADNIRGIPLNQSGEYGYFGIRAYNSSGDVEVIPFMDIEREEFLEYDLTSSIYSLSREEKPKVGFITGLGIDGVLDNQGGAVQPWKVMGQINEFFDVITLLDYNSDSSQLKLIPQDLDALFIVQPLSFSDQAIYAIDQFALNGGKILIALDPNTTVAAGIEYDRKLDYLLEKWGVRIIPDSVAGDLELARPAQVGDRGDRVYNNYLALLGITKDYINQQDPIVSGIDLLNLTTAGVIEEIPGSKTTITSVFSTSKQSMLIDKDDVSDNPDLNKLLRDFKASETNYNLSVRIQGNASSAFSMLNENNISSYEKNTHIDQGDINVIVISDVDFLEDQFWVNVKDYFAEELLTPFANNAAFVVNALENLSDASTLASLRSRGVMDRPFTLINNLQLESERVFREKERSLANEMAALQNRMKDLEQKAGGSVLLGQDDLDAFKDFRNKSQNVQKELRSIKLQLAQELETLNSVIKVTNMAGIPIIFLTFGVIFWVIRKYTISRIRNRGEN